MLVLWDFGVLRVLAAGLEAFWAFKGLGPGFAYDFRLLGFVSAFRQSGLLCWAFRLWVPS